MTAVAFIVSAERDTEQDTWFVQLQFGKRCSHALGGALLDPKIDARAGTVCSTRPRASRE